MMVMRARDRADMYKNNDPRERKAVFSRCPKSVFLGIFCVILAILIYRFLIYQAPLKTFLPLKQDSLN